MQVFNHKEKQYETDFLVIGGGLSGCFAALSAARRGLKVILIQDRPMLGGNASSEVRMWVRGAKGYANKETGLISEFEERNIHFNPTLNSTLTDATLYDLVTENENVTVFFNASVLSAEKDGKQIKSVTAWQLTTYTFITVKAKYFADCSGDCIIAPMVGAKHVKGRESKSKYSETLAQEQSDDMTMGLSIILAARETDKPVKFIPPSFANVYKTDDEFSNAVNQKHGLTRKHNVKLNDNLWWIELGGNLHSLYDADAVRAQLLKCVYGVWDHIKNQGDHGMENWDIDWIGFLPGKRESYRYVGAHVVTENEILAGGEYPDEIAYGGWPLDDHNPMGMNGNCPSIYIPVEKPYGLPYRALYTKDFDNLLFAGRNISVSHVALSSTRVMGTCALLGQAVGTAVSIANKYDTTPHGVYKNHIKEVQSALLFDNAFLPHFKHDYSNALTSANMNISKDEKSILFNGVERPRVVGDKNFIQFDVGDCFSIDFNNPVQIKSLRFVFDRDFNADSISDTPKVKVFAMKLHSFKDFKPCKTANTIVKDFEIFADGKKIACIKDNYLSFRRIPLNLSVKNLTIKWISTHGYDKINLYGFDVEE